jgi:hypothetical protein
MSFTPLEIWFMHTVMPISCVKSKRLPLLKESQMQQLVTPRSDRGLRDLIDPQRNEQKRTP